MSDGMSDARAMDEIESQLYVAAGKLADALRSARNGHRGWSLSTHEILKVVNDCLIKSDFVLDVRPGR